MAQITIDYEEYKELLKYKSAYVDNKVLYYFRIGDFSHKVETLLFIEKDEAVNKLENRIKELQSELNNANKKKGFFSLFKH